MFAVMRHLGILACIAICIFPFNYATAARFASEQLVRDYFRDLQRNDPRMSQGRQIPGNSQSTPNNLLNGLGHLDERSANAIANSVLHLTYKIGTLLNENSSVAKSEIFSPLSIMSSLALLMLGAKGRSYQQLKQILGLDLHPDFQQNPAKFHAQFGQLLNDVQLSGGAQNRRLPLWRYTKIEHGIRGKNAQPHQSSDHIVKVANGLFIEHGYNTNPNYRSVIESIYNAELTSLSFRTRSSLARDHINSWINTQTNGKIPNIIQDDIPESTNLIMATAVYFKGLWENSFFPYATIDDNFYPNGQANPPVRVKMMATGGTFPFYFSRENDCRIIGLPYIGNLTTMYVIQPNDSNQQKLRELQKSLTAEKIEDMISKMELSTAVIAFPKMHFKRNINLKNMLNRLDVTDIFGGGLSDLSLIGIESGTASRSPILETMPKPLAAPADRLIFSRSSFVEEDSPMKLDQDSESERRCKRQATLMGFRNLEQLESERATPSTTKSNFFVEDIVHAVDFNVNEYGTEAAAATLTYLRRSGTDVLFRAETPFMILIRHDPTKLILFYGLINEPELK